MTLFRMKAQPGKRQAVIDQFEKWEREHKAAAKGLWVAKSHPYLSRSSSQPPALVVQATQHRASNDPARPGHASPNQILKDEILPGAKGGGQGRRAKEQKVRDQCPASVRVVSQRWPFSWESQPHPDADEVWPPRPLPG